MESVEPRRVVLQLLSELPDADVTLPLNEKEIGLKAAITGMCSVHGLKVLIHVQISHRSD